jgi:hypothetical protein
MSSQIAAMQLWREPPEGLRIRCFALLMVAAGVWGGLAVVCGHAGALALALLMPPYVLWVVSDLRARRVARAAFACQLSVSLCPFLGLLIYLVWTRRLVGVVQYLAFLVALTLPAGLAAGLALGITQFVRGGRS